MSDSYRQIVIDHKHLLGDKLTDLNLPKFFHACFQSIVEERGLWPAWVCMNCREVGYGDVPKICLTCQSNNVFSVATFQGRGPVTGRIFEEAVKFIMETYFPDLNIRDSDGTEFQDHCDLYVPEVAGIEIKGSPTKLQLPNGEVIKFSRPGMRRSDTEKKANSNANTFKADCASMGFEARFYVLTNAVPKGWQEANSNIDEIYNVNFANQLKDFEFDIGVDITRAERDRLGRR